MKSYRLQLRHVVPLLILCAGLLIVLTAWILESRDIRRNAERIAEAQLRSTANFIAAEVESGFRSQSEADIQGAIERAIANPIVRGVFVTGPDDLVLQADDPTFVGQSIRTAAEMQPNWQALIEKENIGDPLMASLEESGALVGSFPLHMRTTADDLMPNSTGSLFLLVDVSGELARQQRALAQRMLRWVLVLSVLSAGFYLLLRRLLLYRIDRLVQSVRAVSKGDFEQPPDIRGHDELGELGREMVAMTNRLRDHSERLAFLSDHDALTGLLNRHGFETELSRSLKALRRRQGRFVLTLMDVDSLRVINDTQGHEAGDELLNLIGQKLGDEYPDRVALARVGGDEFALLLEMSDADSPEKIAQNLQRLIADLRFERDGERFGVQVSMGLLELTEDVESAASALGYADAACYHAKESGRGSYCVGGTDVFSNDRVRGDMKWVSRVQTALDEDQLRLYAQRIIPVDPNAPRSLHFEVLVRMIDNHGAVLPPGKFLEAAERYNLVNKVDRWVVRKALTWIESDPRVSASITSCSINLSGMSLGDEEILDEVQSWLSRPHGFDASALCFEVTETAAIHNFAHANEFVDRLRRLGCRFALDDFGTGLSSFAYFKRLPVDLVKIDGVFVRDLANDRADYAIVSAINDIAHQSGMKTVAEFVENDKTLKLLREIGVDFAQGYGIARPAPLDEVIGSTDRRRRSSISRGGRS